MFRRLDSLGLVALVCLWGLTHGCDRLPPNIANCTGNLEARQAVWDECGVEPDAAEAKAAFFADKCPLHEKEI
ncbi:hypothetical protein [Thiococcus pfennigii]|uniref:hypothetical protein n=1 Tax=Thiococcus pfennigii TaxID=1057 RepID=UPI0019067E20|nr:hypothetical protein [Thiococcus pfennigii]